MFNEDDDEYPPALYEDGHWTWDEHKEQLMFVPDIKYISKTGYTFRIPDITFMGTVEFKDELDIFEQQRFKKRFQRGASEEGEDVVELQDIKDLVLFTAPKSLLDSTIINILHLPSTDRFIRALILYHQYYLQIADEMARRVLDLKTKISTKRSHEIELEYRENLQDIRVLVAKEYCNMISGVREFNKYHHMGPSRKSRSLIKKERALFESILRMCTQMVWLALGRKSFNQIDLEMHRMFKSEKFNMVARKFKCENATNMSPQEIFVLMGHCLKHKRMFMTQSPLMDELSCCRDIDYRMLGLGVVKYPKLDCRLRHLENILVAPEELLSKLNITLGIVGLPRYHFDTMLREIKIPASIASISASRHSIGRFSRNPQASDAKSSADRTVKKLYSDIVLPPKQSSNIELITDLFLDTMLQQNTCNQIQKRSFDTDLDTTCVVYEAAIILSKAKEIRNNIFEHLRELGTYFYKLMGRHNMNCTL